MHCHETARTSYIAPQRVHISVAGLLRNDPLGHAGARGGGHQAHPQAVAAEVAWVEPGPPRARFDNLRDPIVAQTTRLHAPLRRQRAIQGTINDLRFVEPRAQRPHRASRQR